MLRGLVFLRGAQRASGLCATKWTVGRSLCTSGAGVTKFPMQHTKVPANHFRDLPPLRAALLQFVAEHGTGKTMPTQAQLKTNGRSDLTHPMHLYHGGMAAVADRLGLEMTQDHLPDQHWKAFEVVERELLLWIEQNGTPGMMPTKAQLFVSGRGDIVGGMNKHGGIKAVTAALGLIPGSNPPSVKPTAYWREWENVEAEMPTVSKACGVPEQMPTDMQLQANGYTSLTTAIRKHYGGLYKFAARLELPMQHKNAVANHFRELPPLQAALLEYVAEHGTANTMPTQAQLCTHGRLDLGNAISLYHGGSPAVADQLGLEMAQEQAPDYYWKDFEVVEREVLLWIKQHGTPGTMPTDSQLFVSGRGDLAGGIRKHHRGFKAVTAALGLRPGSNPPSVKPTAYWREWENVKAEMLAVSKACGVSGYMPTQQQLLANGYTSLNKAIRDHYGGFYKFQQRFNP